MTDRIKGCWVAFDHNYREDDVEAILDAIRMTKGVAAVTTNDMVASSSDWVARQQVREELGRKITAAYKEVVGTD